MDAQRGQRGGAKDGVVCQIPTPYIVSVPPLGRNAPFHPKR